MMNTHKTQLLSSVAILTAGCLLTGCSWDHEPAQSSPVKSVQSAVNQEKEKEMAFAKELVNHSDCIKAFQIFRKYAAEGDPEAEAWLGRCYMNGIGTEKDPEKAYEYFGKSAAKNNPWGINGVGVCMQYGDGTAVNLQTALAQYQKAAELKHPLGTLNLARTYADKEGGFFDAEKAESYFKKAIELDAPYAKMRYAEFLYNAKRYKEAVPLLMQSENDPMSTWMLAMCYQNGWGVPVNISKAVELAEKHFRKYGAMPWSAELCFNAGIEELSINGMTETAKQRIKYAADQGHAEAQYSYAFILRNVNDNENALNYMLKAADNGYALAALEAGKMLEEAKDCRRAIKYYTLGTTDVRTQLESIERLSNLYRDQLKTPKSESFWNIKGASLGSTFCRNELAIQEFFTNGDEHFAKAAALFAEGRITANECAEKWLGDILSRDYEKLRTLADKKNSDALLALGIIGCMEEKDHPNVAIGMELLEESAKLKNGRACCMMGNIYLNGILAEKDVKKALSWYQKGADCGDMESAMSAVLLIFGDESLKDTKPEELRKICDKALELEAVSVAYTCGVITEYMIKDSKKAEELYRLSAAFGDPRAMLRLHDMLFKTNTQESMDFLRQAVNLQYGEAELRIGDLQRIWENPREAFLCYLKANTHNDKVNAPCRLAECWLNGYGCEINLNCFWNSANEAYENGSPDVCYLLGTVYRDGKICAKDSAKAKTYFEEGVKRGSEDCKKALNSL